MLADLIRPTDPEAERALIAHVLSVATRDMSILDELSPAVFDDGVFAEVWRCARSLHSRGDSVSPRSVLAEYGQAGNSVVVAELQSATGWPVSSADVVSAHRRVVELHRMRCLLGAVSAAYERAVYADDYSTALQCVTEALEGLEGTSTPREVSAFADAVARWQERAFDDEDTVRVFRTPWATLNDRLSGGLHAGRSYVIGGRPGDGKSLAGSNLAVAAAEDGHRAVIFSVEMGEHEVVSRILASGGRADYGQITRRTIDQNNWAKISAYAAQRKEMPLWIVDKADINVDYVRATCRTMKRTHGLDVVFVDYLQLLNPSDSSVSRERQVAHISRSLKIMSRELDCAVITACQLNRNSANDARPPRMSDLRESGSIEQDADVVILLHRPGDGDVDLIVTKNRTGPNAQVSQWFAGSQAAIR